MLIGTYNLWLVLASLLIAMCASYTALDMAGRVSETKGSTARWWLIGGSVAMGIGIWSMHFVGMLAFNLPMRMGYDPVITFLSLLLAIASSAFALWIVCQEQLSWMRLSTGAVLMGGGVCAMHYTGMAAMRMQPPIRYIPSLLFLSVLIAVTASGTALWIAFRLRQRTSKVKRLRTGAAVVMGIAIAGMHYTGMAAAQFPKGSICPMAETGLSSAWLAPLIILFALGVLSLALIVSMFDFRTSVLASALSNANQELQFLAMHDSLTKLPNRTLLEDRLDQEIENAKRDGRPFSVLFLDLDGFKNVNDAFGQPRVSRYLAPASKASGPGTRKSKASANRPITLNEKQTARASSICWRETPAARTTRMSSALTAFSRVSLRSIHKVARNGSEIVAVSRSDSAAETDPLSP